MHSDGHISSCALLIMWCHEEWQLVESAGVSLHRGEPMHNPASFGVSVRSLPPWFLLLGPLTVRPYSSDWWAGGVVSSTKLILTPCGRKESSAISPLPSASATSSIKLWMSWHPAHAQHWFLTSHEMSWFSWEGPPGACCDIIVWHHWASLSASLTPWGWSGSRPGWTVMRSFTLYTRDLEVCASTTITSNWWSQKHKLELLHLQTFPYLCTLKWLTLSDWTNTITFTTPSWLAILNSTLL